MTGDRYAEGSLAQLLAEDVRIAELGIRAVRHDDTLTLSGEVESYERRATIERVVTEAFPGVRVRLDIGITRVPEPEDVEEL